METAQALTEQLALNDCSLIKGSVLQLSNGPNGALAPEPSGYCPCSFGHHLTIGCLKRFDASIGVELQGQKPVLGVLELAVIDNRARAILHMCATPIPFGKRIGNGFHSFVGIQISVPAPFLMGMLQIHFNPRGRRNGPPVVPSSQIQRG